MNYKGIDFLVFVIVFFLVALSNILNILFPNPENSIFQFVLDTKGNIGGTIVASFFINCFYTNNSIRNRSIIALSAGLGLIIYEFLQLLIKWQTFDPKDLIGTFIGTIISITINILIFKSQKKNSAIY